MSPTLVLFDIDQTLLYSGGAGIRALNLAFQEVTGIADGFREITYGGKTDPQIMREALTLHGLPSDESMIATLTKRYLHHFPSMMAVSPARLKPGVPSILDEARAVPSLVLGLLTGNLEPSARMKLDRFNLNPYFEVGAFGSDDEDRDSLLPIAVDRLRTVKGIAVPYEDCVVVGDTPLDVRCAHVYGARCVGVATGAYSVEELRSSNADLVVPDLSEAALIVEWFTAVRN